MTLERAFLFRPGTRPRALLLLLLLPAFALTAPLYLAESAAGHSPGKPTKQQRQGGIVPRDHAEAPGMAKVLRERVEAHLAAGRTLQAIVTLRRWHEREPANLSVAVELAARTLEALRTTLSRHGTREDVRQASRVFHDALDHIFERDEQHPEANRLFAEYLLRVTSPDSRELERAVEAARYAQRAEDTEHDASPAALLLGLALERQGKPEEAAKELSALLAKQPQHFEALHTLFRLYTREPAALEEASLEALPSLFEVCKRLIQHPDGSALRHPAAFAGTKHCVSIGDAPGAVRLMSHAAEHSGAITTQLAKRLLSRYRNREISGSLTRRALEQLARNPLAWSAEDESRIRALLAEAEDTEAELPELQALLALVSFRHNGEPTMRARLAQEPLQRFEAALEASQEESLRDYPRLLELAADLALHLDDLATALAHYEALHELDPERRRMARRHAVLVDASERDVPAAAARLYLEAREQPGASPERRVPGLEQALELAPQYPAANYLRARIAFNEQLDYETAKRHYRKALEGYDPEEERWIDTVRGLGIVLVFIDSAEALEEAAGHLATVEEQEGEHPTLRHFQTLIEEIEAGEVVQSAYVAYYESVAAQSASQARERLERAFELQPSLYEVVRLKGQQALGSAVDLLGELREEQDRSRFDEKADQMSAYFARAQRLFRQAVELARRTEQRAEALTYQARTLYLNFESSLTQDEVRERRRDLETCKQLLAEALEQDPSHEAAALLLGELQATEGDYHGTHETFRRLLEAKPEAPLFEEGRSGRGGPQLELPEVNAAQAEAGRRVALAPRMREGMRMRYRLNVEMAGYPRSDGSLMEPRVSEIRLEVIIREVRAPGYFIAEIEPIGLRGDAVVVYEPLLDRRFSAEVSTLLGRIDWRAPQTPSFEETDVDNDNDPANGEGGAAQRRQQLRRQFRELSSQFASFVAPALFEVWCYEPGRPETRVGERWGKREASGLLQVGAGVPMESRDTFVLTEIEQSASEDEENQRALATVERRATVGGEVYGEWGRLQSRLEVDTQIGQVRQMTLEMMTMQNDPTYVPPRTQRFMNAEDYTETILRLDLELLRIE